MKKILYSPASPFKSHIMINIIHFRKQSDFFYLYSKISYNGNCLKNFLKGEFWNHNRFYIILTSSWMSPLYLQDFLKLNKRINKFSTIRNLKLMFYNYSFINYIGLVVWSSTYKFCNTFIWILYLLVISISLLLVTNASSGIQDVCLFLFGTRQLDVSASQSWWTLRDLNQITFASNAT